MCWPTRVAFGHDDVPVVVVIVEEPDLLLVIRILHIKWLGRKIYLIDMLLLLFLSFTIIYHYKVSTCQTHMHIAQFRADLSRRKQIFVGSIRFGQGKMTFFFF